MKIGMGTLLTIGLIIMGYCVIKSNKEKHKLAQIVKQILGIGFVVVFSNIVALFTQHEAICAIAFSVYFIGMDWMLYYLLQFSLEYIGNDFDKHVKRKLMLALLVADAVSIILNNVFGHLYTLTTRVMFNGDTCFALVVRPAFYTHHCFALMLAVFCLISLYYGAFKAPAFYRPKYMLIAIVLTATAVVNMFTFQSAVDYSVFGYVIEAVVLYYCTFVFSPQQLLPITLFRVAQDMSVGLFVMDDEGKMIYNNKYAKQLLDEQNRLLDKDGVSLEEWCRNRYLKDTEEFIEDVTFSAKEERTLKIQLQRMVDAHSQLQGGYFVVQDCTEEMQKLKREQYLASHDSLTGLYNKEYFYKQAEEYIAEHQEEDLLIVCTDIKDFKMINDFFGTKMGDTVLINFANLLKKQDKKSILCGRLGNDIFGLLISKADFNEELFINDAQEVFASCVDESATFPTINYVGIYEVTERSLPISVMCDRARMAIRSIKGDYHKRVAYYNNTLRESILREQELIGDLDNAIAQEQFKMYLQPQMSTEGKLLGAEALMRWVHPSKGMIMPGDFIPVFEKNGLISDVDKFIWELACKQLRKWKDEGRADLYISVNISPRDFYLLNIYQVFTDLVEKYELDPQNIKLEITETAIVMDFKRQLELIDKLRQTGFVVEMDDFGSGYSSLNMLKDIHVDVLKIDMAFLRKAKDEDRSKKILQMIISLSKQLDMPVITEGVETAEQVEFLTEMGCDMFQGYYFARPMEVEKFEEFILLMEQKEN